MAYFSEIFPDGQVTTPTPNPQNSTLDSVVDDVMDEPEEDLISDLSDVEIRLEEANCYKALLNNSLFEEPMSPIAEKVEKRIRDFIRHELKVLLGLTVRESTKVIETKSPFTSEEEKVLRGLATRVLSREQGQKQDPIVTPAVTNTPAATPTVKKTTSPEVKPAPLTPTKQKTPKTLKGRPPKNKEIETEIVVNGQVYKTKLSHTAGQTLPPPTAPKGFPALGRDDYARVHEQNVLTSKPMNNSIESQVLATAIKLANSGG